MLFQRTKKRVRGGTCGFLMAGRCLFFHSEEDRVHAERLRVQQVGELSQGLVELDVITARDLSGANGRFVGITECREVASFSKVIGGEIAVPGCPPRFTPPQQPLTIPRRTKAVNYAISSSSTPFHHFTYPFEPPLRAIETIQQCTAASILAGTDILTSAGSLTKLFRLIRNTNGHTITRFEIDLVNEGSTLIISRWEGDPQFQRTYGYGVWFERETCRYDAGDDDNDDVLKRSTSHHRVVAYSFGGLRCLVQAETDGYYCQCGEKGHPRVPEDDDDVVPVSPQSSRIPSPKPRRRSSNQSPPSRLSTSPRSPRSSFSSSSPSSIFSVLALDDPGDLLSSSSSSPPNNIPVTTTSSPTLRIHHTGRRVPSQCLVEVKTRSLKTPSWDAYEEQLYFARRAQLYVAVRQHGKFLPDGSVLTTGCGVETDGEMREWERREQDALGKVAELLKVVKEKLRGMKESGEVKVSLICENDGSGRDEGWRVRICRRVDGRGELVPEEFL
ncbi:hypothetical protein VTJ49DRAFT_931 [Mycothermus thermophilus]|uniref:Uncharacterized protein n=1 Tax=Humicola insolens TaxID=85995 RepID=A0ABR3VDU4_HUMIN